MKRSNKTHNVRKRARAKEETWGIEERITGEKKGKQRETQAKMMKIILLRREENGVEG